MTTHCRGAMGECDARTQGAPIAEAMGATEDAAKRRPARPGGPCFVSLGLLVGLSQAELARRPVKGDLRLPALEVADRRRTRGPRQAGACSEESGHQSRDTAGL